MQDDALFDVAVIGYGPAGVLATGLLAQRGLRVLAIDRDTAIYDKPRAFALDHEVMRVFQELGVAEPVLAHAAPFTPSEYYGVDGQLIKCFSTAQPPYPYGFQPALVFNQPAVEAVLRERVATLPGVTLRLGTRLSSLRQGLQDVTLDLVDATGETGQARARWLIGCDGASSTVRSLAGIALEDLGFDQPWLVVDVIANARGLARLPRTSLQICEPQRPTTYLIGPGAHRRWEIALNEGEDPQHMARDEQVWQLLSRWLAPDEGHLWRQASYRFHALVAQRFRQGRVFLAGDAAHQQPPFLGQGMCQGVRDVANLAWKLAAVTSGQAHEGLLDSYGLERKAHVIALTTAIKGIGELVGERDPVRARARDARLLAESGGSIRPQTRQSVQPALAAGLLAQRRDEGVGTLFPQPWLLDDTGKDGSADTTPGRGLLRMDDRFGRNWRLVLARPPGRALPAGADAIVLGSARASEADGLAARWLAQRQAFAAIVRPDHYVWGLARDEEDLAAQWAACQHGLKNGDMR